MHQTRRVIHYVHRLPAVRAAHNSDRKRSHSQGDTATDEVQRKHNLKHCVADKLLLKGHTTVEFESVQKRPKSSDLSIYSYYHA
eukprot:scaffold531477_cov48-Prasinocladus_malaysianus.AAC.1